MLRTLYQDGFVTKYAFCDHSYPEMILRGAIKVNGFWISSYSMKREFER